MCDSGFILGIHLPSGMFYRVVYGLLIWIQISNLMDHLDIMGIWKIIFSRKLRGGLVSYFVLRGLGGRVRSAVACGSKCPSFEPLRGREKRCKNLAFHITSCHASDLVV